MIAVIMANYRNLLIIGAGGYGQAVKDLAEKSGRFPRIEFLDDNSPLAIGKISEGEKFIEEFPFAIIAIGNSETREKLFHGFCKLGFQFVNIISEHSHIASSAKIGKGCVIEPNVSVGANSVIGNCVFLCAGSVAGHDSIIRDMCQIDYNAVVSVGTEVPWRTKVTAGSVFCK